MLALRLEINGKHVYTAGVEDWDILSVIFAMKDGPRSMAASFDLNISGLCKAKDSCKGDRVRWKSQYLGIGDKYTIKIVDINSADPPIARLKSKDLKELYDPKFTDEELEEQDRELYRKLKHKYEKNS